MNLIVMNFGLISSKSVWELFLHVPDRERIDTSPKSREPVLSERATLS